MTERKRFHVIIDDGARQYFVNDSGNGVRLHFDMQLAARALKLKLRDTELWAESKEAALAEMERWFPNYTFVGKWTSPQSN